uniref:Lymphocyte transmembrane adaptor 1 n=1 Tax=Nannospalax galili TaxID=1026970 RepID=A0A8C6WBS9_NANGA
MDATPAFLDVTRRNSEPSTLQGTLGSLEGPPKQMVPSKCTELVFMLQSTQW